MASNINIPNVEGLKEFPVSAEREVTDEEAAKRKVQLIIGVVTNDHAFEYQKNLPVEFPKWG